MSIDQQRLDAGTDKGCARDSPVGIALHDSPALASGTLAALAQLIFDGSIALVVGRITSVKGTATKSVSYASFQGSKAVVAHQGIAGSAKCHAETLFTSDSKNLVTGFDAIPYVKSSDSNGYVRNGGECTACLYVSGMGEMILGAEYLI